MESKSCGVFDILSTRQMHGHIDMLVATDEYGSTLLHEVSCLHGVVVKDWANCNSMSPSTYRTRYMIVHVAYPPLQVVTSLGASAMYTTGTFFISWIMAHVHVLKRGCKLCQVTTFAFWRLQESMRKVTKRPIARFSRRSQRGLQRTTHVTYQWCCEEQWIQRRHFIHSLYMSLHQTEATKLPVPSTGSWSSPPTMLASRLCHSFGAADFFLQASPLPPQKSDCWKLLAQRAGELQRASSRLQILPTSNIFDSFVLSFFDSFLLWISDFAFFQGMFSGHAATARQPIGVP